ncbi:MAG: aminopeptidase [Anaerolineaceae bacterium]|nr:aminopeptidase [Anaerolineaceae bacterium]MBN2676898.1 aminopeptidase [Anaerolineaceae bacterium]
MIENFEGKLQKYADVVVKIGLNIQPGQRLIIAGPLTRGVDIELAPLVRLIAASAYQAGARYVDVIWADPGLRLLRYQKAPRDSFDEFPTWAVDARVAYLKQADAILTISADNPALLKGQDPDLVGQEMHAVAKFGKPVREYISRNAVNWCVVAGAVAGWAAHVFPDQSKEEQVDSLWNAIFSICRIDQADPVAAWDTHVKDLTLRSDYLNARAYDALHYVGPGTDLKIGLPKGAIWMAAGARSESGIDFIANLPTEEIFTLPHRQRIDGTIRASRPLNQSGSLIEDFDLTFEKGHVVKANASRGGDILKQMLATDEGATSLGEVSFVPYSSPISLTNTLFYNTLIDENAASHLAFGNAYRFTIAGGEGMSDEQFLAAGGNQSGIHVDFMVGSKELDIDGITLDGITEPIMRQGEWAFDF